jgi:glycosyltransferase involved in cell wall biosynthesis
MHWTYPVPLRMAGWRNVYTIHDAIPLVRPDLSPIDAARHARLLARIAATADALVTVSAAAGAEIADALRLPADRIVDCSQPVTIGPTTDAPPGGLAAGGYLLLLGSVEPRKNVARLLAAYRRSGVRLPLVVAGPAGGLLEADIAGTAGTRRLDYVDPADMPALIGSARALVMPSLAEGFGLPVAEAMALGTPVLTSAGGALAETAGGAALLVDPEDTAGIAAALHRIAGDDGLCAALSAAGLVNAARFTPDRFATRLAGLYAGLVAGPRSAR